MCLTPNADQSAIHSMLSPPAYAHEGYYDSPMTATLCRDMNVEDAIELGRRSIYHATFRDAVSGGTVSGK